MIPTTFISHGSPGRILGNSEAKVFLDSFSSFVERPKAVLVISAHWTTQKLTLTQSSEHQTIYDFSGFPKALSQMKYPAEQPQWLTKLVESTLSMHGENIELKQRGLDHGAWTVLAMAYPKTDIPVIGLSLPVYEQMHDYFILGEKLADLRKHDVLILGSGSAIHNLYELDFTARKPPIWAEEFTSSLQKAIEQKDYMVLTDIYKYFPHAARAHPTSEHYLPLLIALGAAQNENTQLIHDSYELGSLNNSSWLFGDIKS